MHATPEDTEININDSVEVKRWCDKLDVTEGQLRDAVMNVGNKLGDVEKAIAKQSTDDGDITPAEDIPEDRPSHLRVTSDGAKSA